MSLAGWVLCENKENDAEGVLRADESARLVLHILGGQETLEGAVVSGE